jgi:hypothetical protein
MRRRGRRRRCRPGWGWGTRAVVFAVEDAVAVDIETARGEVAGVAELVAVEVRLASVGDRASVVGDIERAIEVGVGAGWGDVAGVALAVAVGVEPAGVGDGDAVVGPLRTPSLSTTATAASRSSRPARTPTPA